MKKRSEKMFKTELRFGPAGMPIGCKGKALPEGIEYVAHEGLNAFEVEFVRGVRIKKEIAFEARKMAEMRNVLLSCHGPYFINCCSPVPAKQQIAIRNIIQTVEAAAMLGAYTIVFHPGYYQEQSPEKAFDNAFNVLKQVLKKLKERKLHGVLLGLETVGKKSQFGSLDENIELCGKLGLQNARPVIDFAHVHARENGCLKTKEDYEEIFSKLKKNLGSEVLKQLHCHFTEVVFSDKGERYHLNVGSRNSPPFKPLAELIASRGYKFTIISESPLLDKDALKMKRIVESC